jgi:hypothetical protein
LLSDVTHQRLKEKPADLSSVEAGAWGANFGMGFNVLAGYSYKLQYNASDVYFVDVDCTNYLGLSALDEVTLYFNTDTNILYIESNNDNSLPYFFQEYHASFDDDTADTKYGMTYSYYSTTNPADTTE